jgi:oligoendopeptidase F
MVSLARQGGYAPNVDELPLVWKLEELYASFDDPRYTDDIGSVEADSDAFTQKWLPRTDWPADISALVELFDDMLVYYEAGAVKGNPGDYADLRYALNTEDSECVSQFGAFRERAARLGGQHQFVKARITAYHRTLKDGDTKLSDVPELVHVRHFLREYESVADHMNDEQAEAAWAARSELAVRFPQMLATYLNSLSFQALGEDGQLRSATIGDLPGLGMSAKPAVRASAAARYRTVSQEARFLATHVLNAVMADSRNEDAFRRYRDPKRPYESTLMAAGMVDPTPVETMAKVVWDSTVSQRFYAFKGDLLGIEMTYGDRVAPYGEATLRVDLPTKLEITHTAFGGLDPQFAKFMERMVETGHIDLYPRRGKTSNRQFCQGPSLVDFLPWILLNDSETFDDLSTWAHELGHALQYWLTNLAQNAFHTGILVYNAEASSTFFQTVVIMEAIDRVEDDETRLMLLIQQLDQLMAAIPRQIAGFKLEIALHTEFREKGDLSADRISELFVEYMGHYLGDAVDMKGYEDMWTVWSHFFNTPFYIPAYAFSNLAALVFFMLIKGNRAVYGPKLNTFLEAGSSAWPHEIFQEMGIDINDPATWETGMGFIEDMLAEAIALAEKLGKI